MSEIILIDDREFRIPVYTEESVRTLGGPGSGNFGHSGRPGEVGGSAPEDGPAIGGSIRAQKEEGVRRVEALLDKAVKSADFTVAGDESYTEDDLTWSDFSSTQQDRAFENFRDQSYNEGVEVDDSEIISDLYKDLYRDNEKVVEEASQKLIDDINNPESTVQAFQQTTELPFTTESGEPAPVVQRFYLDPDTIEAEEDTGDGAPLNEDALRLTNGEELTPQQKEAVDMLWSHHYEAEMDKAKERVTESDEYSERRNELESEEIDSQWNNMSDSKKIDYLDQNDKDAALEEKAGTGTETLDNSEPDNWIVDTEVEESTGRATDESKREDYDKTRILARKLAELRTSEILTERGLSTTGAADIPRSVWEAWKGSSTSDLGLALQLAAAEELGGHHRLNEREVSHARQIADQQFGIQVPFADLPKATQDQAHERYVREFADYEVQSFKTQNDNAKVPYTEADVQAYRQKAEDRWEKGWESLSGYGKTQYAKEKGLDQNQSGMERLKAYTRAQWETTQFLMEKAEKPYAEVYRGIILPKDDLDKTTNLTVPHPDRPTFATDADREKYEKYYKQNLPDYVQLPDIEIKRNGASSTSSNADVSNNWGGAGGWKEQPRGSQRVVLRFQAPATSLISIPVFGQNLHNESEYVLIGTKDKWNWDAWRGKAPTFEQHPIGGRKVSGVKAAEEKKMLVIDMAEHDKGPHWLTEYRDQRAKPRYAKRRPETAVHAAADAHVEVMRSAAVKAFKAGRAALNVPLLRSALTSGNRTRAVKAVAAVPGAIRASLLKSLPGLLLKMAAKGGQASLNTLRVRTRTIRHAERRAARAAGLAEPRYAAIEFDWGFDDSNPRAQKWAREHAAELAKGISDTTRDDIADALVAAFDEGGDTNTLIESISEAVGDEDRGELIAVTEPMIAVHEGQREAWRQAVDEGGLPPDAQREWITTGDMKVCPECESLEGTTADVDGLYPDPGGEGPPLHPRCRCTEGIAAPRARGRGLGGPGSGNFGHGGRPGQIGGSSSDDEGDDETPATTISGKDLKENMTGDLAAVAQKVYDEWQVDPNQPENDDLCGGGICHLIADEMVGHLSDKGIEATTVSSQIGEQHVWVVAKLADGVYSIDIPPGTYETGGGYSWQKIPDVTIDKRDVVVDLVSPNPEKFTEFTDEG